MKVLVGSKAMEHWGILNRKSQDVDYFSNEMSRGVHHIDGEKIDIMWHDEMLEWEWGEVASPEVATPEELLSIKLSHITHVPTGWANWNRDIRDIQHLRELGYEPIDELVTLLAPLWSKRKANLNKTKEEFFTPAVTRLFDHDSLHDAVAYPNQPMFKSILKEGSEVLCDKEKFFALPEKDRDRTVMEEVMALTLERDITMMGRKPSKGKIGILYAQNLNALITRLSSGWFPRWAAWHYPEIIRCPEDLVEVLVTGIENGIVTPMEGDEIPSGWWDELL